MKREGQAFTAEVRGLSERLAQESGRLYTATCSADLGDGRCSIDLTNPAFLGAGAVILPEATAAFTASRTRRVRRRLVHRRETDFHQRGK